MTWRYKERESGYSGPKELGGEVHYRRKTDDDGNRVYVNPALVGWYKRFLRGEVGKEIKVRITTSSGQVIDGPCKASKGGAIEW